MTKKQKEIERAKARREALVQRLGGRCTDCRTKNDLEVNHIFGRNYSLRQLSYRQRVARYEREEKLGLLNIKCRVHNAKDWYSVRTLRQNAV